jgi:2-dehydro-3-deoxy-D-gluconate 5-dehydrogenase
MALALARHGANVAVAARSADELAQTEADIRATGVEALAIEADLGRTRDAAVVVERALDRWGRLDVLVTSAGFIIRKPAEEYTEDEWDRLIGVGLKARFFTCQRAGQAMLAQGSGSIITVSSLTAALGVAGQAIYHAANAGVVGFTRALAAEWTPRGVRVNCIAPGTFTTYQTEGLLADPQRAEQRMARIPARRFGDPAADLDGTVVFLASDASAYISGQTFFVDGGTSATY